MAYRDMPDCIVPPSHLRCEALTKRTQTYQEWRREPHRCIRKAVQSRAGHAVCACHARMKKIDYHNGEPDKFRHKRFWRWPNTVRDIIEEAAR